MAERSSGKAFEWENVNSGSRFLMGLSLRPATLQQANSFVELLHRHHGKSTGHRFSIACYDSDKLVGVAIVGRPVARMIEQYLVCEVNRLCTDGTKNVCSFLYSACARIAREMGFAKIITYILESESGDSLKASGWICEGPAGGGNWSVPSRRRVTTAPQVKKTRWVKEFYKI